MKKILIYILCMVIFFFLIPIIFTKKYKPEEVNKNLELENIKEINEEPYDYKQYTKVRLLHKETGEVEELDLDTYLLRSGVK